jgi:hypothetical protein
MSFENFGNFVNEKAGEIKKKVRNVAKIAAIGALGIVPMATQAGEHQTIDKDKNAIEVVDEKMAKEAASNMIKSDSDVGMLSEAAYYYSQFPQLEHEEIDSLIQREKDNFVARADKQKTEKEDYAKKVMAGEIELDLTSENHSSCLTPEQRQILNILYPEQVKKDPGFKGGWIPPSDNLVDKYKKGLFKTKDDLIRLNQLSQDY